MADWDESNPGDSQIVSQFPANERSARAAVKTNFGVDHHDTVDANTGKHKRVVFVAPLSVKPTLTADEGALYTKTVSTISELFFENENGVEIQITSGTKLNETVIIPSGTVMLFQQTSAPTGWTKLTDQNDRALRIVSGTAGTGGSVPFSTVFGRTATDSHTLTAAQSGLPSHNHDYGVRLNPTLGANGTPASANAGANASQPTDSAGGTNASEGHSHNMDIRVLYTDVIRAQKD